MANKLTIHDVDECLKLTSLERNGDYVGSANAPTPLKCQTCGHEFQSRISTIRSRGSGCPRCSNIERGIRSRKTMAEIDKILRKNGVERNGPYVGRTNEPTPLRCIKHGHTWKASASNVATGHGCPDCFHIYRRGASQRRSETDVKQYLLQVGIRLGEGYVGTTAKPTPLECMRCGYEWSVSVNNVKQGTGCPRCSNRVPMSMEELDTLLSNVGLSRNGECSGRSHTKHPVVCNTCAHAWEVVPYSLKAGTGCPNCARDPWLKQGIYHLNHPEFPYQYVGISRKPKVRLEQHKQDDGVRGDLAREIRHLDELSTEEVYDILDSAWEEGRLPEYVINWFEQNPHGKLPRGRLWFIDWGNIKPKEKKSPARIPRFVAEWIEAELIRIFSVNFNDPCPFITAGKVQLANIHKNAISA